MGVCYDARCPSTHFSFSMVRGEGEHVWLYTQGWVRRRKIRGNRRWGGPFPSSAWHKPISKHADSFNDINERHWGLGSSWALQQGDSPPTASLAGHSHVFIKSRAFHVLWKPWDEWAVSSRKVNGRRRDPSREKELRAGPCQRIGLSLIKRNKEFP